MATNSPKKLPRVKPKTYTTVLLYNTNAAVETFKGLTLALCNPTQTAVSAATTTESESTDPEPVLTTGTIDIPTQFVVSDKMSCNYCDTVFTHRLEQKRHYRSDWHRYNLKLRLKGRHGINEEQFEEISGNISSLSGSDTSSDSDSDTTSQDVSKSRSKRLVDVASRLVQSHYSSTDSESDTGYQNEELARRLPKMYYKNSEGQLLSLYRCVVCHKKFQPSKPDELITLTTELTNQMTWAIFMAGGGHFAAAIFAKDEMIAHKTFHRYVVRAKRGTAQGSRDSQGNAPKSAGASLRRYNEAALIQEVHDLIASWNVHLQTCDRIFLRAPSFNSKIFFSGKNPPFAKNDMRIRSIPFQTRRPTFNEVRRVHAMLASIECYGDANDLQDLLPLSPPKVFNPETGSLSIRDESQLSPRQRKILNKKLRASPLVGEENQDSGDTDDVSTTGSKASKGQRPESDVTQTEFEQKASALPGHVVDKDPMSSGTSTASDTELVETMETINLMELKEFSSMKKPKRKKKSARKKGASKYQEPDADIMEEEKFHLKNNLYTACKVGDVNSLKNLLAIFSTQPLESNIGQRSLNEPCDIAKDSGICDLNIATSTENETIEKANIEEPDSTCDNSNLNDNNFVESKSPKHKTDLTLVDKDNSNQSDDNYIDISQGNNVKDSIKDNSTSVPDELKPEAANSIDSEKVLDFPIKDSLEDNKQNTDTSEEVVLLSDTVKDVDEHIKDDDNLVNHSTEINSESPKPMTKLNTVIIPNELNISEVKSNSVKPNVVGNLPDMSPVVTAAMLNEKFGDNNTTLLHVASKEGHKNIVVLLMATGADPAVKDKGGQTPFMVSKDKPTRNEFRKFMGKWPDKYDYSTAQIPAPLTEEQENEKRQKEQERKKAQKKAKQERQKVQRDEETRQAAEEREKNRYLNLSDREKRALAAEKRLVSQVTIDGGPVPVLSRCYQCGSDMTGKVPFEYSDNKFCTSKCLQAHRKSQSKPNK